MNQLNYKPWHAKLELGFVRQDHKTILAYRKHEGPLRVQKALWPEDSGVCHVILVHPPAGIAGGDQLEVGICLNQDSHAVITTPGAGKWYGSDGRMARQSIHLNIGENAVLEWLPQEAILFDQAQVEATTQVQLHPTASFMGWDILVLGRQAREEYFQAGQYQSQFQLWVADQLLTHDHLIFTGQDRWLASPLGAGGHAVIGTFWAHAPLSYRQPAILDHQITLLRELVTRMKMPIRITRLDTLIAIRYLGDEAREAMDGFAGIRAKLRRLWFNLDEAYPRIWKT